MGTGSIPYIGVSAGSDSAFSASSSSKWLKCDWNGRKVLEHGLVELALKSTSASEATALVPSRSSEKLSGLPILLIPVTALWDSLVTSRVSNSGFGDRTTVIDSSLWSGSLNGFNGLGKACREGVGAAEVLGHAG